MSQAPHIDSAQSEDFTQVQQLIALKRFEQPDDAYFEEFLDEFHRRQRESLLASSSLSLLKERVGTWFSGLNKWNIVYAGGLAYAVIFFAFFFMPKGAAPIDNTIPTAPVEHVKEKKDMLSPDTEKAPVHETY
ncbi:MAG: hypothetical protein ACPG32_10050 [Akkermansiaceae bacterium]